MSQVELVNEFFTAAKKGELTKLQQCLGNGIDVNSADNKRYTALHKACSKGHLDCVKLLIKTGADVNILAEGSITPLHLAAENGHFGVVKTLVENGGEKTINHYTTPKFGNETPLHWLVKNDPSEAAREVEDRRRIVRILKEHGANLDAVNDEKKTALHLACVHAKYLEIVQELLQLGAKPNMIDKNSATPRKIAKITHGGTADICKVFEAPEVSRKPSCQPSITNIVPSLYVSKSTEMGDAEADGTADVQVASGSQFKTATRSQSAEGSVHVNMTVNINVHEYGVAIVGDNTTVNNQSSSAASMVQDVGNAESKEDSKD